SSSCSRSPRVKCLGFLLWHSGKNNQILVAKSQDRISAAALSTRHRVGIWPAIQHSTQSSARVVAYSWAARGRAEARYHRCGPLINSLAVLGLWELPTWNDLLRWLSIWL